VIGLVREEEAGRTGSAGHIGCSRIVPLRLIQCAARSSRPHKARMMTPGRRTSERTTIFADSSAGKRQNT
jgi:hypothetical protein